MSCSHERSVLLTVSYLVTSARSLLYEPPIYGSLRMLDAIPFINEMLVTQFGLNASLFKELVNRIEKLKLLCNENKMAYSERMSVFIELPVADNFDEKALGTRTFFYNYYMDAQNLVFASPMTSVQNLLHATVNFLDFIDSTFGFRNKKTSEVQHSIQMLIRTIRSEEALTDISTELNRIILMLVRHLK